jgi:hypothetical protein
LHKKLNLLSSFNEKVRFKPAAQKYIAFVFSENMVVCRHPASARGTFRPIVTIREAGMRWTRLGRETNGMDADSEIVWSWPPGAEAVREAFDALRKGARKPVPKESTYKP